MKDSGKRKSALLREVQQLRKQLAMLHTGQHDLSRAERALAQYWSVLDAVLSGTADLYTVKGEHYSYQAANQAFCRFLGIPEHEIRGHGDFELFPSALAEIFHRDDVRVLQAQASVDYESRIAFQDSPRWLRFRKRPIFSGDGRCAGVLSVVQDVSELVLLRTRQRVLTGAIHDAYWCTDLRGCIVDVNVCYCRITGYSREEVLGKNVIDIEMLNSQEILSQTNERIIKEGSGSYKTLHRTKNSQFVEFEAEAIFISEHGGRIHRFFREQPCAATSSPVSISPGMPKAALLFPPPHRRVLNLNDILVAAINREIDQIPPGISIRKVLDPALKNCVVNSAQIGQIILNITTNAIEAMEGRGHLSYTTRNVELSREWLSEKPRLSPGHYVYLAISDTGKGIVPSLAGKIFEPFITTKFKGRGMGLASVARNVDEHHGLVTLKSEVGKGTTFTVYLPASDAPQESGATVPQIPSGTETILILDPESRVLDEARSILNRLAYTTVAATNVPDALRCMASHIPPVDAIVIDSVVSNDYEGDLIADLRRVNPGIKIILASSEELDAWTQDLLDAGAHAFVKKPFRPEVLAPKIRKTLDS